MIVDWISCYLLSFICVLGLSFWWCQCAGAACQYCSTDTDTLSVTFANITDNACASGCSVFNDTFLLGRDGTDQCKWTAEGSWSCGEYSRTYKIFATFAIRGGGPYPSWYVDLKMYSGAILMDSVIWYENPIPATITRDCTANVPAAYMGRNAFTSNNCAMDTATCELN